MMLFSRMIFCLLITSPLAPSGGAAAAGAEVQVDRDHEGFDILNPCLDFGFKTALKDPLVAKEFLNTILKLDGDDAIAELEYVDPALKSSAPLGYQFTVDVLCHSKKGEHFLIEMQNDYREDYADKVFVEFSRLAGRTDIDQLQARCEKRARTGESIRGKFWEYIKRIIAVVITNKDFPQTKMKSGFPAQSVKEPEIVNTYTIAHTADPTRRLGNIDSRIVLVTLANLTVEQATLASDEDRWLYAFLDPKAKTGRAKLDAYKRISDLDLVAGNSEGLKQFYRILKTSNFTGEELTDYTSSVTAFNSAMTRKLTEGIEIGEAKTILSTMISLHEYNAPEDMRRRVLAGNELPEDQIDRLLALSGAELRQELDALKQELDTKIQ